MLNIILYVITCIFTGLALIFKNIINIKRSVLLFILGLVLPFLFIIIVKGLKLDIDRKILDIYYETFMKIALSLLVTFMLKIFTLLCYALLLLQISFHGKYNANPVGKNLKELASKENIDRAHTIINLLLIPAVILMLYGIWFKTKF